MKISGKTRKLKDDINIKGGIYMKRIIAIVLVAATMLVFMSCSKKNSTSPGSSSSLAPQVVYLYQSDTVTAAGFQTLLDSNGYSVNTVTMANAGTVNFGSYSAIVISDDSSNNEPWGTTAIVNAITKSAKPVLGIYQGGGYFFDAAGNTSIGWMANVTDTISSVNAVTPASSIWSTPNVISTSSAVNLYSSVCGVLDVNSWSGVTLIGQDPGSASHYPLVSVNKNGTAYFLWGFQGNTSTMTTTGKNLFINVMKSL